MADSTDAIAEFLARGGSITRCAPASANAIPLRELRKRAEQSTGAINVLARDASGTLHNPEIEEYHTSERAAERRSALFGAARASGLSTDQALAEARLALPQQ